ncbi:MAG: relaxase/mobilization nuclease domain-containing protein [Pseudomonadota bacterium]
MVVPVIPSQRQFKSNAGKRFNDLVSYLEGDKGQERGPRHELTDQFGEMLDYATSELDPTSEGEKCIALRTHGVNSLETASIEMNAVSRKNTRCDDPVYHFILSWPEHERPEPPSIFDAAVHAINALGLGEHQYVIAVHGNTDNMHCHIAVNRIHPLTFLSHHIEWATTTLHYAARESEIKHGWSHDNGIYIVQVDGQGNKTIALNPAHAKEVDGVPRHAHSDVRRDSLLPAWHDPESLESWLKTKVAKALKEDLPDLSSWHALHVWLEKRSIKLVDTGGGGLRLQATSSETSEILDMAASKGLRLLKRAELEKRWGPFSTPVSVPVVTTDLSNLSTQQILKGVEHVISNTLDRGIPPPDHVLRAQADSEGSLAAESSGVHDVPHGRMDAERYKPGLSLPGSLPDGVGDREAGSDSDVRRAGDAPGGGRGRSEQIGGGRDYEQRAVRREQRAAARKDLRERFAHYRRLVRSGDSGFVLQSQTLRAGLSEAKKEIKAGVKAARAAVPKSLAHDVRLLSFVEIDAEALRRRQQLETEYQLKRTALTAERTPPLSWRTWLTRQADLGDQAALSALRGIVYQAQRDAKRDGQDLVEDDQDLGSPGAREKQYQKVVGRLLDEERKEIAIRAASVRSLRPYELDALLIRQAGMKWRVTGNGNVEYRDLENSHLYTDRGNRVTFDRVMVTNEEIQLALLHAQSKFGRQITLTGDDVEFAQRMACLADDMGLIVLNPDLQATIELHRASRKEKAAMLPTQPLQEAVHVMPEALVAQTPAGASEAILQAKVMAIDPQATFVSADTTSAAVYLGPVAAEVDEPATGFAQHIGRGVYVIHTVTPPTDHEGRTIEVKYHDGQARLSVPKSAPSRGRGDK